MTSGSRPALLLTGLSLAGLLTAAVSAQSSPATSDIALTGDIAGARREIAVAEQQGKAARLRAEKFERETARVTQAADRTARESAAVAARIQETEAKISQSEARLRIIAGQRGQLREQLALRQQPLVRLIAALQRLSRRPPALALLRPGSVRDTMYMRALLATMLPQVEQRTAALRGDIERGRVLEQNALAMAGKLRADKDELRDRRKTLVALETRQRLALRQASGNAAREGDRALALAEKARDLGDLVGRLGMEDALRDELARLPGPLVRPPRPEESQVVAMESTAPPVAAGLPTFMLPVSGQLVTGFGATPDGQPRSQGIALATRPGAQAVAPASGRVVFAGPYRGYGNIVIIDHDGGWTSLVTGLVQLDAHVGEQLVAGSPLGVAGAPAPIVTVELRRNGKPVNPLQYIAAL